MRSDIHCSFLKYYTCYMNTLINIMMMITVRTAQCVVENEKKLNKNF